MDIKQHLITHEVLDVKGIGELDSRYLKLTADNDPITGDLLIKPTSNSTTTFQIQPSASTTPTLIVDTTNGRVGIGTASPSQILDIVKDGAGAYVQVTSYRDNLYGGGFQFQHARGTKAVPAVSSNGDITFLLEGWGHSGSAFKPTGAIEFRVDGVPSATSMPGSIIFKTTPATTVAYTDRMTILNSGNIGIGTTTPLTRFHLAGNTSSHYAQIDTGLNFDQVENPTATGFSAVVENVAGNVNTGDHYYCFSYVTPLGETRIAPSQIGPYTTDTATSGQVTLTIPVSTDYRVTKRRIYRSPINDRYNQKLLVEIADNTTTTYVDNIADASLGATSRWFLSNTTNTQIQINGGNGMFLSEIQTVIGQGAGAKLFLATSTGIDNVVIGGNTGNQLTTGSSNILIGDSTGASLVSGGSNIMMGNPGGYRQSGSGNVMIGQYTGYSTGSGDYNTLLGRSAGGNTASSTFVGSNNLFLGAYAGFWETGSNKFFVDTLTRTTEALQRTEALMYGVIAALPANQTLAINAGTTITGYGSIVGNADVLQLKVKGNATQTANLQEWQNSGATVLMTIAPNGSIVSQNLNATATNTSGMSMGFYAGLDTTQYGLNFSGYIRNNGLTSGFSQTYGIMGTVNIDALSANSYNRNITGIYARIGLQANLGYTAATLNPAKGILIDSPSISGAGTITCGSVYGLNIANQGKSIFTNSYGLYIDAQSGSVTSNYAIYTNAGLNRLGDQLSVVGSADRIQLIVKGNATQTTNLQEWQNSGGTVLGGIEGRGTYICNLGYDADSLFIGRSAGKITGITGVKNTVIGSNAFAYAPTTANNNVFIGYAAGIYVTEGSYNVGIGNYAVNGTYPMTSSNNFGLGYSALKVVSSGGDNVAIGSQAQAAVTTGQANISIGRNTLYTNITGEKNTAIGSYSGYSSTGSGNIYIGYNSGYRNTSSNILIIDNQDRTTAGAEITNSIIYGVMAATPASQTLAINAVLSVSDGAVFNEGGLSTADFRVESDTEANMLFLDANGDTDGALYLGGTTNGIKISKGGELSLIGTATVYDDVVVNLANIKAPTVNPPVFTSYRGCEVPAYSATATNVLYFTCQLPHARKDGSDIEPHIHVAYPNANAGNSVWSLTYSWANIDGTFSAETTITQTFAAGGTTDKHVLHSFGAISGVGKTYSSVLLCSLSRIGGDAADTYGSVIYAVSADIHVEKDKLGTS